MLVGWSYGGFILCNYVRAHGQERIGAIDFAAAATKLGETAFGTAFPARPLPADEVETLVASSMTVPAWIRASLAARELDGDDVLRTLRVPLLVTQGRADTVVLPAMADHILATCPTAEPSWCEDPTASTASWPS